MSFPLLKTPPHVIQIEALEELGPLEEGVEIC